MATYSIYKGNYIRPAKNVKIEEFPEAASQTFRIGDPLILQTTADKGHQVKIAAADPTLGTVVGFAMVAASGVENTPVSVAMFTADAEFVVCVQDTGVIDNDDIGDEYGIVADATNQIWRLDLTETTAKTFRITRFGPKPDGSGGNCVHGDVNGTWIAKTAATGAAIFKA
jgi:hypothetical protein